MLVAAAFCPHPPLLLPQVGGATEAAELDGLRDSCARAVAAALAVRPDLLWVVGDGPDSVSYPGAAAGSMRRYGVDVRVRLDGGPPEAAAPAELPLSLTVGGWLLGQADGVGALRVGGRSVVAGSSAEECLALGADLAGSAERVSLLVMGDGSARRSPTGNYDPAAADWDQAVADAMATADTDRIASLEPERATGFGAAGRASWQVAAGAVRALPAGRTVKPDLLMYAVPHAVSYFVATWLAEEGDR